MTSTTFPKPEPYHDPSEDPNNPEYQDQDSSKEEESSIQSISSTDFPSPSSLPHQTAFPPSPLTFSIARVRKTSSHPPLITFGLYTSATTKPFPILFAHQNHWKYKKSRQELSFYKGSPIPSKGTYLGGIDFHHWLLDASRAVKILLAADPEGEGEEEEIDIRKSGWGVYSHRFEFRGRAFAWRKAREQKLLERLKLECVDSGTGERWATYASEKNWCAWNSQTERAVGRFEICREGVDGETMGVLMMSFVAVQTHAQKRIVQGSQAGWGGGLGAAVLYSVGG